MRRRQILTLATTIPLVGLSARAAAAPAAVLWQYWSVHDPRSSKSVDHTRWRRFLSRYVMPSRDGINRVAYGTVRTNDRAMLRTYLADMAMVQATGLSRDEQFSYWVNLYNAMTLDVVLDHYPVDSIRNIDISPGFFADGPWGRALLDVEGMPVSLDDIEHRILRPIWRDPRIHYAVNCAALGCPNLSPIAYSPTTSEQLLAEGASAFVNHDRGCRIENGQLRVSSIYRWFEEDFGGDDAGVIDHLKEHAKGGRAAMLASKTKIAGHAYDWQLNDKARTN